MMRRQWRAGLVEMRNAASASSFVAEAARMVPALAGAKAEAGPAGIRAQALTHDGKLVDDFVVHRTENAIHIRTPPPRRDLLTRAGAANRRPARVAPSCCAGRGRSGLRRCDLDPEGVGHFGHREVGAVAQRDRLALRLVELGQGGGGRVPSSTRSIAAVASGAPLLACSARSSASLRR